MKTIKMNELSNWLVTYITDFIHGAQAENAPEFSKWAKSFKREEAEFVVRAEFVNDWGYDERSEVPKRKLYSMLVLYWKEYCLPGICKAILESVAYV